MTIFGYNIKKLQKYFDTLPADTTKIVVDYSLLPLSFTYYYRNISVTFSNNEQIVFDLTRFNKLSVFKYNLHGIHYTRKFYMCCTELSRTSGNDYVPIFAFNSSAPLKELHMPYIVLCPYKQNFNYIITHFPSITHIHVKDFDLWNRAPPSYNTISNEILPTHIEILQLYEPSTYRNRHYRDQNSYNDFKLLFDVYFKNRIRMIANGVYQFTPEPIN